MRAIMRRNLASSESPPNIEPCEVAPPASGAPDGLAASLPKSIVSMSEKLALGGRRSRLRHHPHAVVGRAGVLREPGVRRTLARIGEVDGADALHDGERRR